jgi:hypothetical protein
MQDTALPALDDIRALLIGDAADETKAAFRAILLQTGNVAGAIECLARLAEQRSEWTLALVLWEEFAREVPGAILPFICQADIHRVLGDISAAQSLLARLPANAADDAEVLRCRLRLAQVDRAWHDAFDVLDKLRALGTDTLDMSIRAVDMATEQQNLQVAEDILMALPAQLAGHPLVRERRARLFAIRGDWDSCYDGIRPLLFLSEPLGWAVHQTIWILVELRRFEALHQLRADLARAGPIHGSIAEHMRRAEQLESEFVEAKKKFLADWAPNHANVRAMVAEVRRLAVQDVAIGDAGAWHLYSLYPNDFDVLCLMADPPLVKLSQHRARYFERLIYVRYPRSEIALFMFAQNLYSCKQYKELVQLVHRFGIENLTDAGLLQLALTAQDIVAADPDERSFPDAERLTNQGFKWTLDERKRHALCKPSLRRPSEEERSRLRHRPRIALCISGQLRGYQECFPSVHRHIISRFATDVFVQTWRKVGNAAGAHGGRLHRLLPSPVAKAIPDHWSDETFFLFYPSAAEVLTSTISVNEELLSRVLAPARCHIEDEAAFEMIAADMEGVHHPGVMNQYKLFYQMSRCLERAGIMEPDADGRYDLVVWMRPDIRIPRFHLLPLIEDCIEKDFYVSSFLPPLCVGDFIIIGTPANMRVLASVWPDLRSRNGHSDERFCRQGLGPTLLANYLFQKGGKVKHTDMFVCDDSGPHGAKPNRLELLGAMLRDAVKRPEWLPFEATALEKLIEVCLTPKSSAGPRIEVEAVIRSLLKDYSAADDRLISLIKKAGLAMT